MKIVLVTGGNRGIGLETCRQLDALGYTVILGSRDLEKGLLAAKSLSKNIIVRQLDVRNERSIQRLSSFVKKQFGKLDILINNAGLGSTHSIGKSSTLSSLKRIIIKNLPGSDRVIQFLKPIGKKLGMGDNNRGVCQVSPEEVRDIMETNCYGAWRMIQAFIPLLDKSEEGRIINISSGMGQLSSLTGDAAAYRLSKTSLNALTIMFSHELKANGIKVNAMCPGWTKTDMGGPNAPREVSQGADTIVWLCTEKSIPTSCFFKDRKKIDW